MAPDPWSKSGPDPRTASTSVPPVHVWLLGVRGSCPAPGADFVRIGGNTSCVAIGHDAGPPTLVLDAGTGIRSATSLLGGAAFSGTVILGHLHWDHIFGLPFFSAGDRDDAEVRLLIPAGEEPPPAALERAMSPPCFPITTSGLRGAWTFGDYGEGRFVVEGFDVLARDIPHTGGRTMGLRVSDGHSSLAYLSDHSPHDRGDGDHGVGALHDAAVQLADGVDLLIHDAQYTADELPSRRRFGHAAADYALLLGERCGVGRVVLFHHDPSRRDDEVDALVAHLRGRHDLPIDPAVEGRRYDL